MSTVISGIVANGLIVLATALPEGACVEIHLVGDTRSPSDRKYTATELRKLPQAERDSILAAAAALAEDDYRNNEDLTELY